MTVNYQEIARKNEEIRRSAKRGRSKNGRFGTTIYKDTALIKTEKTIAVGKVQDLPLKLKLTFSIAEKYRIKQEIKQSQMTGKSPEGLYSLAEQVEKNVTHPHRQEKISKWDKWKRFIAYEEIYAVAFNRGIRHERQRRKSKTKELTAFDIIGADDAIELSHELGVSEDKLTYAVMEVISKRKSGGKA